MTRDLRLPGGRFAIAIITISAIAGTLSSCGRYGSPVRAAPSTETTTETIDLPAIDHTVMEEEQEEEEEATSAD